MKNEFFRGLIDGLNQTEPTPSPTETPAAVATAPPGIGYSGGGAPVAANDIEGQLGPVVSGPPLAAAPVADGYPVSPASGGPLPTGPMVPTVRPQAVDPRIAARLAGNTPAPVDYSQPNPNAAGLGLQSDVLTSQDLLAQAPAAGDVQTVLEAFPAADPLKIWSMDPAARSTVVKTAEHAIASKKLDATAPPLTPDEQAAAAVNQDKSDRWLKVYGALSTTLARDEYEAGYLALTLSPEEQRAAIAKRDADQDKMATLLSLMPEGTQLPSNQPWAAEVLHGAGDVLTVPQEWVKGRLGDNAYDIATGQTVRHKTTGLVMGSFVTGVVGMIGQDSFAAWANDPANADLIKRAYEGGFQHDKSSQRFDGGRAVWELFIDSQDTLTRALYDTGLDPWSYTFAGKAASGFLKGIAEGAQLAKVGGIFKGLDIAIEGADLLAGGWVEPVFDRLLTGIRGLPGGLFKLLPKTQAAEDAAVLTTNILQINAMAHDQKISAGWTLNAAGQLVPPVPAAVVPNPVGSVPNPAGSTTGVVGEIGDEAVAGVGGEVPLEEPAHLASAPSLEEPPAAQLPEAGLKSDSQVAVPPATETIVSEPSTVETSTAPWWDANDRGVSPRWQAIAYEVANGRTLEDATQLVDQRLTAGIGDVDPDWRVGFDDPNAMYRQPVERLGTESEPPLLGDSGFPAAAPDVAIPEAQRLGLKEARPREVPLVEDSAELGSLFATPSERIIERNNRAMLSRQAREAAAAEARAVDAATAAERRQAVITINPRSRGDVKQFLVDGQPHPYVRDRIVRDEAGSQVHNIEVFNAHTQEWERIHDPIDVMAVPKRGAETPTVAEGVPLPDDFAPHTEGLRGPNLSEVQRRVDIPSVQSAIRNNLYVTPNRGRILPEVATKQTFGGPERGYSERDLSIGDRWYTERPERGVLRGDQDVYHYKPVYGSYANEPAQFGGRPLRLASKDRDDYVSLQVLDDDEEWISIGSLAMTRAEVDRYGAQVPAISADMLNEVLRSADNNPRRAFDAAKNLGIINQPNPQSVLAYATKALYEVSPGFRKWADSYVKRALDAAQVQGDLLSVRLPKTLRGMPLIRNLPMSDETTRVITQRMTLPDAYGYRNTYFAEFNKTLGAMHGPAVDAFTATPQQIMAAYPKFLGKLMADREIPDPNLLGKILDRLSAHYSEFTLLMPWSLPRQIVGNTIIGNVTQMGVSGQLFALRNGVRRDQWTNLVRYATRGSVDPLDTEIGTKITRYGLGGYDPRVVSHSSIDVLTGRLEGTSAARATREDWRALEARLGATKTGKVISKWAGKTHAGWIGKIPEAAGEAGIGYVEFARNLVNGIEYAQRTSLAFSHTDVYIRRHLPGFVEQAVDRAKGLAPILKPSEVRAAIGGLPKEFSAVDVRDQLEKLYLLRAGKQGSKEARIFSDRVARDYAGLINDAGTYGFDQMSKVLFHVQLTKADSILRRVVPFHLYTSRAVPFYAKQALKHPGFALAYYRAMNGLDKRAKDEGWPSWLHGYAKLFDGPAGMDLYFKPLAALGMLDFAIEAGGGYADADKTILGRLYEDMSGTVGVGFYPWLVAPFALSGAMGNVTFGLDPLGSGAARKYLGAGVQLLAASGILGDDLDRYMGKPYEQRLRDVREWISDVLPGIDTVESTDTGAGAKETIANIWLDQELKRRNLTEADWHELQVSAGLDAGTRTAAQTAQAGTYNEIIDAWGDAEETDAKSYQQAVDGYAKGQFVAANVGTVLAGPRTTVQDSQLAASSRRSVTFAAGTDDGVTFTGDEEADSAAYVQQYVKEFGTEPSAEQLEAYIQAHPTDAQLAETTPQARGYLVANSQWNILGTEASRALQDTKNAILFGYIGESVRISGRTFTAGEIRGMDKDGRDWLAGQYLLANDPTGSVALLEREQDAFKASHPEFKEFRDWAAATRGEWNEYGGSKVFRERESAINPGAALYYADRRRAIMTDHPEYTAAQIEAELDKVTFSMGAYFAIYGIQQRYTDKSPSGNSELAHPRVPDTGGGVTSGSSASQVVTSGDVSQAIAAYELGLATANAYLSQHAGHPVDYRTLIPPAQDEADKQLQYAGITMPDSSRLAEDYYDWRDKQRGLGLNSSVAAYAQVVNAGGDWREQRKEDWMPGGWSWVSASGDDYTNWLGFGNDKEGSLDPMGQRISLSELVDNLLNGQKITSAPTP